MKPVPRSGVGLTSTVTPAGLVYTFGGVLDVDEDEENVLGNFSNEMHSLDLAKQMWRLVELREQPSTTKTSKKSKAAAAAAGKDAEMADDDADESAGDAAKTVSSDGVFTMVLGGGGGMSASADKTGKKAGTVVGNVPSPRMKASLVVCKKQLYLFGGIVEDGNKQFTLADLYSLGEYLGSKE